LLCIVEGPDGAGKSTLVAAVAAALRATCPHDDVEVWHAGPPPPGAHPLDLYARPLYDYRPGVGRHIICDRWHVGEWVYPAVFGRPSRADEASRRWLDMFLQARGALLVHVNPPLSRVEAQLRARGDSTVVPGQLPELFLRYHAEVARSRLRRWHLTHDSWSAAGVAEVVLEEARRAEDEAIPLGRFATYAGPARPHYLLLGDVRHQLRDRVGSFLTPRHSVAYGPAFGPYPGTSGHYLLTYLPEAMFHAGGDAGIGVANACDVDDWKDLWDVLGEPLIVTLGVRATRELGSFARGSTPHPQYARRFHFNDAVRYGQAIHRAGRYGEHVRRWHDVDTTGEN